MNVFVKKKKVCYFYTYSKIKTCCRCEIRCASSSRVICHMRSLEASVGKAVVRVEESYRAVVGSLHCHLHFPSPFTQLSAAPTLPQCGAKCQRARGESAECSSACSWSYGLAPSRQGTSVARNWVLSSPLCSSREDGWRSIQWALLDPWYLLGPSEQVNGCRQACFVGNTVF